MKETNNLIVPHALAIAAKTLKDKPAAVGEILVALVTGDEPRRLTDLQRYVIAECREEFDEIERRRAADAERKRRFRERTGARAAKEGGAK